MVELKTERELNGLVRLDRSHADEVNALRLSRLRETQGFTADEAVLVWSEDDDQSLVLGIREEGRLIATQRMDVISEPAKLRTKLDYDGFEKHIELPCLVVGKAATAFSHAGRGLNSYLNALAVEHAQHLGLRYVVETVVADGPRTGFLSDLGFEFYPHPLGWRRFGYHSTSNVVVAVLDLNRHPNLTPSLRLQELYKKYPASWQHLRRS